MDLIFPDGCLETVASLEMEETERSTGIMCNHCHRMIKGRVHQYNNQFFDSYCWNLRFILRMGDEEEQRKEDLKEYLSSLDSSGR